MLLYSLRIDVQEKLHKITSSDIRRFILAITDGFANEIKSKINFHITEDDFKSKTQRKIPYLLFAKPLENSFKIFAYGEVGFEILEKIKEIFPDNLYLKKQKFTLKKLIINEPESIMPKSSVGISEYLNTSFGKYCLNISVIGVQVDPIFALICKRNFNGAIKYVKDL